MTNFAKAADLLKQLKELDLNDLTSAEKEIISSSLNGIKQGLNSVTRVRTFDIVFCKFSDGYIYPCVVGAMKSSKRKKISVAYLGAEGENVTYYTIPWSQIYGKVEAGSSPEIDPSELIAKANKMAEEREEFEPVYAPELAAAKFESFIFGRGEDFCV